MRIHRPLRREYPRRFATETGTGASRHADASDLRFHGLEDGGGVQAPPGNLGAQPAASFRRQLVVLGPAVVLRDAPLGRDQPAGLEAMQGLVEAGILDGQDAVSTLAYP